jgi:hypothetical protein
VDGRTIDLTSVGWEASILEDGRLHTVLLFDKTRHIGPGAEWTWIRVSPASPNSAQITADRASGDGAPPSNPALLQGTYLLEGTGILLWLTERGEYSLDDRGELTSDPADRGTFEFNAEGTLTLETGPGARACPEGTRWVWHDVRLNIGAGTVRAAVEEDDGRRGLGPDLTWVRLSP